MGIKIKWIDPNIDPLDTVEIWKAATKTGDPVKIGEVPGSVKEFIDENAQRNTVSWYTLVSVLGGSKAMGWPFPVGNYPDSGPGPQTLLRGDWEFGCFGEVPPSELPSYDEIKAYCGVAFEYPVSYFTKWVIDGRIVFIPCVFYNRKYGNIAAITDKFLIPVDGLEDDGFVLDRYGYGYAIRPPLASCDVFTEQSDLVAGGDTTRKLSETAALMSTLMNADTVKYFTDYKFGDIDAGAAEYFATQTRGLDTSPLGFNLAASPVLTPLGLGTPLRGFWPVYQLLLS